MPESGGQRALLSGSMGVCVSASWDDSLWPAPWPPVSEGVEVRDPGPRAALSGQ